MKNNLFVIAVVSALLSASCGDESPFPGHESTDNGTYFKYIEEGKGTEKAEEGGAIFVKIKFKTDKDSAFYDLNEQAQDPSFGIMLNKPKFKGDMFDMLSRLKSGDSVSFFIRMDSLKKHYKEDFNFQPPYDSMTYLGFAVRVDSIFTKAKAEAETNKAKAEQQKQMVVMQQVMAIKDSIRKELAKVEPTLKKKDATLLKPYVDKNMAGVKPDANGIYYKEITPGSGEGVKAGTVVGVKYTGRYLDGTLFDANTFVEGQELMYFPAGQQYVVKGFDDCVMKMKKGGKSVFVLPPKMGYNDSLTRVFEVELIEVNPKK